MTRSHQEDARLARATLADVERTIETLVRAAISSEKCDEEGLRRTVDHAQQCLHLTRNAIDRLAGQQGQFSILPMIPCLAPSREGDEYILVDARGAAE